MRLRVLIADDNESVLTALRRLCAFDCDVVGCFTDGVSLLVAGAHLAPDVVAMDLQMPGLNGLEVCRRLKATRPQIRVVLFSADGSDALKMEASTAGADAFVSKFTLATDLIPAITGENYK